MHYSQGTGGTLTDMALEVPPAFLSTCTKTVLEALLYPPPPLHKLRKSPKLIRSLRLL